MDGPISGTGWQNTEVDGAGRTIVWTSAVESSLEFSVPTDSDLALTVNVITALVGDSLETLNARVGELIIPMSRVTNADGTFTYSGKIRKSALNQGRFRLWLYIDSITSPKALGVSGDDRQLGLLIDSVALEKTTPPVETNFLFEFAEPVPGYGWSDPEQTPAGATFVWMIKPSATFNLWFNVSRSADIQFRLTTFITQEVVDTLTLEVNGEPVELTRSPGLNYRVIVPANILAKTGGEVQLTFKLAKVVLPSTVDPNNKDPRTLGVSFNFIKVLAGPN
jgi:hypothetical protein